jgi:hypothetical protein
MRACAVLLFGRDGVFKVDNDLVGAGSTGFVKPIRPIPRHEKERAGRR